MSNWIFQNKEMKGSFHWKEACKLCNQWILEGEPFYLICIPNEIRKKGTLNNFIVHKDEWNEFIDGLSTDEEIANKLISIKKPRRKPHTEEQLQNIEYFKEVCKEYGFYKDTISKDKRYIKMKKRKTSMTIIYDIVYDRISYETRFNEGLFGGLFLEELVAKIRNAMYKKQGVDKHDDFSAKKVVNEAVKMTNEIMGR